MALNPQTLHEKLVRCPPSWAPFESRWDQVALSARIRLARNLGGTWFPERLEAADLERVAQRVLQSARLQTDLLRPGLCGVVRDLEPRERDALVERRIISPALGQGGPGRAYAADDMQRRSILINEEDHVRLQVITPGMDLHAPWRLARQLEESLRAELDFAYDPELGWLTACPSNVGTGLRASVMLHLPGLVLMQLLEPVAKGLNALGYTMRGAFGEGSEGVADCFQISNQSSLGESEEDIISSLTERVREIICFERAARLRLWRRERCRLADYVGRAYGIVCHAHLMTTEEAVNAVSALVTGVRTGLLRHVSMETLNRIFLEVQPGHLQGIVGRSLVSSERDEWRARRLRHALGAESPRS